MGLSWWLIGKESTCQCRRPKFDPSIKKMPRKTHSSGNPLQYSCLENPIDRGAWWALGRKRFGHDLATKQQNNNIYVYICVCMYIYAQWVFFSILRSHWRKLCVCTHTHMHTYM